MASKLRWSLSPNFVVGPNLNFSFTVWGCEGEESCICWPEMAPSGSERTCLGDESRRGGDCANNGSEGGGRIGTCRSRMSSNLEVVGEHWAGVDDGAWLLGLVEGWRAVRRSTWER